MDKNEVLRQLRQAIDDELVEWTGDSRSAAKWALDDAYKRFAALLATPQAQPSDYEAQRAVMEGERNAATEEYFNARSPLLDTIHNRRIFEAGFQRGYERAPAADQAQPTEQAVSEQVDERALNEAGWEFMENAPKGSIPPILWNNLKTALRPAIALYLKKALSARSQAVAPAVSVPVGDELADLIPTTVKIVEGKPRRVCMTYDEIRQFATNLLSRPAQESGDARNPYERAMLESEEWSKSEEQLKFLQELFKRAEEIGALTPSAPKGEQG